MNNIRRKKLAELQEQVEEISALLEELKEEEREAYENLPESLQASEKGKAMENAVDALEYAIGSLADAIEDIDEAAGGACR